MISETQLSTLDNKPIKVNKKSPPQSINPDLTPLYFTAMFIGAKCSGKTYGLVKMIKNTYITQKDLYDERIKRTEGSRGVHTLGI